MYMKQTHNNKCTKIRDKLEKGNDLYKKNKEREIEGTNLPG